MAEGRLEIWGSSRPSPNRVMGPGIGSCEKGGDGHFRSGETGPRKGSIFHRLFLLATSNSRNIPMHLPPQEPLDPIQGLTHIFQLDVFRIFC